MKKIIKRSPAREIQEFFQDYCLCDIVLFFQEIKSAATLDIDPRDFSVGVLQDFLFDLDYFNRQASAFLDEYKSQKFMLNDPK